MTKLKQIFRQFGDGTLVAKDEQYPSFKGYQHIQSVASDTWYIQHNICSSYRLNVFINNQLVTPSEVIESNNCELILKFESNVSGFANLIFLDNGSSSCITE